jgi:hypothetical protein
VSVCVRVFFYLRVRELFRLWTEERAARLGRYRAQLLVMIVRGGLGEGRRKRGRERGREGETEAGARGVGGCGDHGVNVGCVRPALDGRLLWLGP